MYNKIGPPSHHHRLSGRKLAPKLTFHSTPSQSPLLCLDCCCWCWCCCGCGCCCLLIDWLVTWFLVILWSLYWFFSWQESLLSCTFYLKTPSYNHPTFSRQESQRFLDILAQPVSVGFQLLMGHGFLEASFVQVLHFPVVAWVVVLGVGKNGWGNQNVNWKNCSFQQSCNKRSPFLVGFWVVPFWTWYECFRK